MAEDYISQWDALQCFEDWKDAHGNLYYAYEDRTYQAIEKLPPADVRPVVRGKWEKVGEQMLINLENAREQYAELGYPHRKILNLRCSSCRMVTMVDSSIAYDFCPHCGADMREVEP